MNFDAILLAPVVALVDESFNSDGDDAKHQINAFDVELFYLSFDSSRYDGEIDFTSEFKYS